jgi:hypothetical protein
MNKPKKGTKIPLPRVPGKPAPRPKTDPGKINKQPINKPMPIKPGMPTAAQKKAEQIKKLKEQTLKANARKQDRLKTIKGQTRKGMR